MVTCQTKFELTELALTTHNREHIQWVKKRYRSGQKHIPPSTDMPEENLCLFRILFSV